MIKRKKNNKSILSLWFFKVPAIFSLTTLGLTFATMLGFGLLMVVLGIDNVWTIYSAMILCFIASLVIATWLLIRSLPTDNLDRRSYITISNGLSIICFGLFTAFVLNSYFIPTEVLTVKLINFIQASPVIGISSIVALTALILYMYGATFASTYAVYRRSIEMGVPKWKAILSIPFGHTVLELVGYVLPDDSKKKPVIEHKKTWLYRLTDWVMKKPANAFIIPAVLSVFPLLYLDWFTFLLFAAGWVIFVLYLLSMGGKKLLKSVGGMFGTIAVILNIVFILSWAGMSYYNNVKSFDSEPQIEMQADSETIEIME